MKLTKTQTDLNSDYQDMENEIKSIRNKMQKMVDRLKKEGIEFYCSKFYIKNAPTKETKNLKEQMDAAKLAYDNIEHEIGSILVKVSFAKEAEARNILKQYNVNF